MQLTCAFATAAHGTPQLALGIISRSNNYNWVCVLHIAAASQTYSAIFIPDFNIFTYLTPRALQTHAHKMHTTHNAHNAQCIYTAHTLHATQQGTEHTSRTAPVPALTSTSPATAPHARQDTPHHCAHAAPLRTRHSLSSRRRV